MTAFHDVRKLTGTEPTRRGVAGLVADAENGSTAVQVAAAVPVSSLAEMDEAAADLRDLTLVLTRSAADTGRRRSFDDVLAAFGHTRESLAAVKDDDSPGR